MKRSIRTPQTRGLATRERLIKATLDEMHEVGFRLTTTNEIAARAQVSRGALLHHFPTKEGLILAAMEALLTDGTAEIRAVATKVRSGELSLPDFVEFLWGLFSGRFFYLSLEMITQARIDPALRQPMIAVVKRFHEALDSIWVEFCADSNHSAHEARIILNLTVCLVRGMGVQTVLRPEPDYFRDLIEAWKALIPSMVSGRSGDIMFASKHFRDAEPAS